MGSKTWATIVAFVVLLLAAGYYFRPFWWESYRYENDQVRVRLSTHGGEDTHDLAGTLVIRLTGPGRPYCGWHPVHRKQWGPARDQLLRFDSVTSSVTDVEGYADAAPHSGFGHGERGLLFGGCQYTQGYILILSRPGFVTEIVRPDVAKINHPGEVLHRTRPRKAHTSEFDYAQRRLGAAINLLYPSRIFDDPSEQGRRHDLMIVESMPVYWQHRLPDGRRLRDYAIEIIRNVSKNLECPTITADVASVFASTAETPDSNDKILEEHRALARLIGRQASNSSSCRPTVNAE